MAESGIKRLYNPLIIEMADVEIIQNAIFQFEAHI